MAKVIDLINLVERNTNIIDDNFGVVLIFLIMRADNFNKERLRKGFPNAVKLVEKYQKEGFFWKKEGFSDWDMGVENGI